MKIQHLLSLALAMWLSANTTIVSADEPDDTQDRRIQSKIERHVDGKTITIRSGKTFKLGPRGNVEIQKFGEGLPEDFKIEIMAAIKESEELRRQQAEKDDLDSDIDVTVSARGVVTVVGPDGRSHSKSIEGSKGLDAKAITKMIRKALAGTGGLSEDLESKLLEALSSEEGEIVDTGDDLKHVDEQDSANVMKKLDQILDRLEKLESDVADLKNS